MGDIDGPTTFMGDESLSADPSTELDRFTNTVSNTALLAPCNEDTGLGWKAQLAFVDATAARSALDTGEPQATTAHVMGRSQDAHLPGAVVPSGGHTAGVCFEQAKPPLLN
ncbi:hypothetical protein [Salipiger thiooxidans]|uniref:hypothetical protein n=1 Tax=Salipiger thiooxidans TaxID=282683 RepID=UPI001CFA0064|nr:hypothetical protein [Salipiger thiooxidans]